MDAERERRLREALDVLFSWPEKTTVAPNTVWGQSQGNGGTPRPSGDGSTKGTITDEPQDDNAWFTGRRSTAPDPRGYTRTGAKETVDQRGTAQAPAQGG